MKVIRNNVFETNSSSTHTIIIPRNKIKVESNNTKTIIAHIGEYGWEYHTYHNLLDYIYTAICCIYDDKYKEYTSKIDEIASKYNIKIEWEEPEFSYSYDDDGNVTYCYLDNGYIDHSDELEDFLTDLFADDSLVIDAIFSGYVNTGNDNEDYSEGWEDDEQTNEDCYYYYKGN